MTRKNLALVKTLHPSGPESEGKNILHLHFNRPLHRFEAMGIAMLIAEDLKRTD